MPEGSADARRKGQGSDPGKQADIDLEAAIGALQEHLEVDDELDPDDLKSYVKDRSNWNKQQNRRNQEAAEARRKAEEEAARVREELAEVKGALQSMQRPQSGSQQQADPSAYYRQVGVPEDDDEPVTAAHLKRAISAMRGEYGSSAQAIVGALQRYGLLKQDQSGRFVEPVDVVDELQETRKKAEATADNLYQVLAEAQVSSLIQEYPDADEDKLWETIRSSDADDIEAELRSVAEETHERFQSKLSERQKSKAKRRKQSSQVKSMVGAGAVPGGDKAPNPWRPGGMKELLRQQRELASEEAV